MTKRKPRQAPRQVNFLTPPPEFTVPDHALPIWLGHDGQIYIGLRSPNNEARGHTVKLNPSPEHLAKQLLNLLTSRARQPKAVIAQPGAPIQAMLEALTRSEVKPFRPTLRVRDLDDEDLEFIPR